MGGNPIKTQVWRRLRAQVIREEPICRLQFDGVCTGISNTADHIIPRSQRPDLMFVRSNLQGACGPCNRKRGNNPIPDKSTPKALAFFTTRRPAVEHAVRDGSEIDPEPSDIDTDEPPGLA